MGSHRTRAISLNENNFVNCYFKSYIKCFIKGSDLIWFIYFNISDNSSTKQPPETVEQLIKQAAKEIEEETEVSFSI